MARNARPTRVAILDDDASVRTALVRTLKAEGMVVIASATSDELFDTITRESLDCLVLDLQMRGMNGLEVLKRLRQMGVPFPTLVLSGSNDVGSRSACLNAGAAEYLRKPVDADRLIKTIDKISA